ncbi:MAG: GIY-YIG nuclease family protein [Bacteroidales bacterium]
MEYYIYILENQDGIFYKGITTNIEKRLEQHNDSNKSKYTSSRGPWILVYLKKMPDKRSALIEEKRIKKLNKLSLMKFIKTTDCIG